MHLRLAARVVLVSTRFLLAMPALPVSAAAPTGTTTNLSYSPTRINFGKVAVLATVSAQITITNTSGNDLQFLGGMPLSGTSTVFAFLLTTNVDDCFRLSGGTLTGGSSCTVTIAFTPLVKSRYKETMLTEWALGSTLSDVTGTAVFGSS